MRLSIHAKGFARERGPKYPHYTPYQFSGNKLIAYIELEGLEEHKVVETRDEQGNIVSQSLEWDESLEPFIDSERFWLVTINADGTTSTTWGFADDYEWVSGNIDPTPAPSSIFNTTEYYSWRHDDFVLRHALMRTGLNPPTYYMQYGNKYVNRFTYETKERLSPAGQVWCDNAFFNLQNLMENELMANPEIELDNGAFQSFAFDTHVPAYENAGLFRLPLSDLIIIGMTPDWSDMLTEDGQRQVIQITQDYLIYLAACAKTQVENINFVPDEIEYWEDKGDQPSIFDFDFLFRLPGLDITPGY